MVEQLSFFIYINNLDFVSDLIELSQSTNKCKAMSSNRLCEKVSSSLIGDTFVRMHFN